MLELCFSVAAIAEKSKQKLRLTSSKTEAIRATVSFIFYALQTMFLSLDLRTKY